jgi:hypothetical protein
MWRRARPLPPSRAHPKRANGRSSRNPVHAGLDQEAALMTDAQVGTRREAKMTTPTGLGPDARQDIAGALNGLLADTFALSLILFEASRSGEARGR